LGSYPAHNEPCPTRQMAKLLYGAGLRVKEGLRLRVKDVDFAQRQLIIRDTKGNRDRLTMLPKSLSAQLQAHLVR
jgi:site-specific recombinase XerD